MSSGLVKERVVWLSMCLVAGSVFVGACAAMLEWLPLALLSGVVVGVFVALMNELRKVESVSNGLLKELKKEVRGGGE